MNKWLKIGTTAAIVAAIALVSLGAATTYAQGPTGTTQPMIGRSFGMGGFGEGQNSLVAIAAKVLGMDQTALFNELNTGKTIADVAKAKNVSLDKISSAFIEARTATLKSAVDAKRITQAQADTLLTEIKSHLQADLTTKFTAQGYGRSLGFADANKDGVCDACGINPAAGQTLGGNGQTFGRGRWNR
jgi:hypothetical protein